MCSRGAEWPGKDSWQKKKFVWKKKCFKRRGQSEIEGCCFGRTLEEETREAGTARGYQILQHAADFALKILQHDFVKIWELVDGQVSKGRERILGRKAAPYQENAYAEASKLLSQQLLPDGAPYEITVRNSPCEGGVSKLMDHPLFIEHNWEGNVR